ncbi:MULTISPECIES: hypothetical protein [unclassified Colwellia]|uniref:hypothetical protein n=1 Tax=unclassified Colwellia TaxID=196834 RepID=UPI0015F74D0B|nr:MULTISPECIES: hypothetical protein [unclassified Colwellia]MBA6231379.1 hypothetical protein [Colwellia sp. MB02u-7]MBA6235614.1 hypothetical protein [Colwellia sp. MB02u-11]MBA6297979.1 hypothetical protein [Colwellia sp. MB3u-22]MBA6309399.1 hypothetical protein [Colwellia sp. MB3u-64]
MIEYFRKTSARRQLKRDKVPEWRAQEWYVEKRLALSLILITLAISLPLLALYYPYMPPKETIGTWFQRSGSLITFLGVCVEFIIFRVPDYVYANGSQPGFPCAFDGGGMHEKIYRFVKVTGVIVILLGTLIWGYGDIPFRI